MWLSGWGNYPKVEAVLREPFRERDFYDLLGSSFSVIGRGRGRSYGDSSLNQTLTLASVRLNYFRSFDESTGILAADSGVSLEEILNLMAPRGWFLPVVPGTSLISLGGAVAADVHGKNHHVAGSFGDHVEWLEVWTSKSGLVRCSKTENPDLFWATIGGHGLTGFIVAGGVKLVRVPSSNIRQTLYKTSNLEEIMDIFENDKDEYQFSVAWIDCLKSGSNLGRSILMAGDWSVNDDPKLSRPKPRRWPTPFNFPSFTLNKYSVKIFNSIYYNIKSSDKKTSIVNYEKFFFPLDAVSNWNRIYGRAGFCQWQIALPWANSRAGLPLIVKKIADAGAGSFLAVLKLFGQRPPRPAGNISFPTYGYTLALDFPKTERNLKLLAELDVMALDFGARSYLAKDSRMTPETLSQGYGASLTEFLRVKEDWDPIGRFRSIQSDRLKMTGRA
ncbi:MAG: FAD-binding oxidoreductase [Deltaproteobacteria bacterium]|jgi:FAD/FMN-containing dehydrogenase|nr:FAD-binding oxidoreductase [Deltaproteobacteria bacterium]